MWTALSALPARLAQRFQCLHEALAGRCGPAVSAWYQCIVVQPQMGPNFAAWSDPQYVFPMLEETPFGQDHSLFGRPILNYQVCQLSSSAPAMHHRVSNLSAPAVRHVSRSSALAVYSELRSPALVMYYLSMASSCLMHTCASAGSAKHAGQSPAAASCSASVNAGGWLFGAVF